MSTDTVTIPEAAERLGLDRSNVLRRARRGDFGPIQEIGIGSRPSIILISAAGLDAYIAQQAS